MSHRILVIGGGYAGLCAAVRIRQLLPAAEAAVCLVDARSGFVERIRLHEAAAGATLEDRPFAPFLRSRGIDFLQGTVVSLSPADASIVVERAGALERLP